MKKLVILISPTGKGTNLEAILKAIDKKIIPAVVQAVVSESESAPGIVHARSRNTLVEYSKKKTELIGVLEKFNPDFVVLCGWKQFIPSNVLEKYKNRILNLHPGIVPDNKDEPFNNPDGTPGVWNKGLYADLAIENFIHTKATYAGSSVHFLTDEFDFGPVLGRAFEKIYPNDTIKSLYSRLKEKEHGLYVEVLSKLCRDI